MIAYGLLLPLAERLPARMRHLGHTSTGILFGGATAGALLLPIHLGAGASVGSQAILLALAAPVAGYTAGLAAMTVAVAVLLLPAVGTGSVDSAAILTCLSAGAIGLIFRFGTDTEKKRWNRPFRYVHLPLLGLLAGLGGVACLGLTAGWSRPGRPAARPGRLASPLPCFWALAAA